MCFIFIEYLTWGQGGGVEANPLWIRHGYVIFHENENGWLSFSACCGVVLFSYELTLN